MLLVFTGCVKPSTDKGTDTEQPSINLELVSGDYRAIWEEDYKYDTPILIDNLYDWKEFLNNHPAQSTNEDVLQQDYDDAFFEDSVIYAYLKSEGSGSNKLTVSGAKLNGDKLELFMERIVPEEGTDDMATRICLFGVKKDNLKNIKEVEGIILESPN